MSRLLEICCDSLESVMAASAGGADRIELCSCLECDGLTPSAGLIECVIRSEDIPVFVMIRPRAGNFEYSETDLEVMCRDIGLARRFGAAGIVSGALATGGKKIDAAATSMLVRAAAPLPLTFHRAFDLVGDPLRALEQLAECGVARVLTSGGAARAVDATDRLSEYQSAAAGRLAVVACGGIRSANIRAVAAGCRAIGEFHSAALTDDGRRIVDEEEVLKLKSVLDASGQ